MNRKLELDPAIEALPEVITRHELDRYLDRQQRPSFAEQMYSTLIELCLSAESKRAIPGGRPLCQAIPPAKFRQITSCLSQTMTWDQLHLYGSKVVTGDVLRLQLGLRTFRKQDLIELAGSLPIRLCWTRNRLLGLLQAATGLGSLGRAYLGKTRLAISNTDTVTFHAVGDEEPRSRRLIELDKIVLG